MQGALVPLECIGARSSMSAIVEKNELKRGQTCDYHQQRRIFENFLLGKKILIYLHMQEERSSERRACMRKNTLESRENFTR